MKYGLSSLVFKKKYMKKTLFLIIFFSLFASVASAKKRSTQQLMQVARTTLASHFFSASQHRAATDTNLEVIHSSSQLTVIGGESGFAVIANDDIFPAVLGYSDKGFNDEQVAPGYKWWLEAINEQMEYNLEHGLAMASVPPSTDKFKASIPAMLITEWGQNAPYYNNTPTYGSGNNKKHYVTGCVATAMSQIMYYHKWPEKGKGSVSYYFTPEGSTSSTKLTSNLAAKPYDWDNMLPIYKGKQYSEEQGNAVALLMMHCGYAVNMQYTTSGSGAFTSDAADALRKRFYYNENMHYYWRSFFNVNEWMEKIYQELNDNCPVLYGGNKGTSGSGHEFVIDGYDEDGLVHVNWGWDGNQNGYFDIASLNGYTQGQEMVLVRRNDADVPYESYWGMETDLTVSAVGVSVKANCLAYNLDYNSFKGIVGFLAMNLSDQTITEIDVDEFVDPVESLSGVNFTWNGSVETMADGTYRLYAATKNEKDSDWRPIRCTENVNNSYLLTIANGHLNLVKENDSSWTDITRAVGTGSNATARYYDLQGREVTGNTRGLIIRKQGDRTVKVMNR